MKRLWLLTVCAGFGLTSAFAADPYVLASGSETLTGEGLNFSKLEVNGALTLAEGAKLYVTNSTETSLIGNGVGVTATLALERNAECRLSGGKDNYLLNIGVLGGDARISIAEGAFFETTGSRFCMSRNTDDQRDLASYSEMNISGTARITYLEMNGYFPVFDSGVTYDATTFPVRSRINVLSGGVLELAGTLQVNDQAMAVISLQNGTLRYGALMTTLSGGGAVRYEIPEGFEGTIDTGAFNAALTYNATPHFAFFSGSGTLRKRGVGSLSCKLLPACNTFTGPIIVEEGTFSLGRPLAEDQTVYVASGAKFIPASEEDLAKVTWVDGAPERSVYVVTGAVLDGIDLLGMSILYFDNTLACSAGLDGSVIGTVTHADATREDPFSITQLGNKTLTLTDTGLEDIPIHFSGAGATLFGGDYIWGAGRDGDWLVDAGSTVGQSGAFMVAGEGPATFTFTQGTFRVSKDLCAGWDGASGTITVSGGQVEVNGELVVGGNPSDHRYQLQGEVHISNATVNAAATHMAPNTDTSGANRTTRYNAVYLHEGGHLHTRYIHRNDDPLSSVIFDGGKLSVMRTSDGKYDSRSMFVSYQNGMLTAEALPDRDIWLEVSPVHNAYMSLIGSGNVKVTLQGEGGFRKEGIGHLLMNKVGTTVVDYHGDTKLNYGITRIGYADVIPHGEGYGDLVIGQHAAVDLYGYPLTVNRLVGLGGIGNGRTDRGADFSSLRVLNIDADWSFARALPAATLIKDDPNTLTLPGSVPDSLRVKAGAVALPPVAYRHYRFKVENTFGADANSMQIAEFKLLDGETDVTGARSGFSWSTENPSNAARLYPDNEAPGKAVDGDLTTKYLDFRARPLSSDADRDNVWLQFDFDQPQQVTHYNWATANDKAGLNETDNRNPSSWRILGSDDGETWTDLSIYGAYSGTNSLRSWTEPLGFPLTGTRHGFLKVEAGASVTIDRPFYLDYLDNAGTVTLGDAGSIVCGQGDAPGLLCGTLEGTGGLTKIGEGRVAVAVPNSYAGPTRVKGGTLAFQTRAEGEWEWFRFTVKKNHSQSIMQLSELYLYDAMGARINGGLTLGTAGTAPLDMAPGTCCQGGAYATGNNETLEKLFDDSQTTKLCSTGFNADENDASTWRSFVFRLANGPQQAVSYLLRNANDSNGARNPVSWTFEGSSDGIHWVLLDEHVNDATTPMSNYAIFNNGVAYDLLGASPSTGPAFGTESMVEVAPGAKLALTGTETLVGGLTVDIQTGAGTIEGFAAAPKGTLALTSVTDADDLRDYRVPVTLVNPGSLADIPSWGVTVNGVVVEKYRVSVMDGALVLRNNGLLILVR